MFEKLRKRWREFMQRYTCVKHGHSRVTYTKKGFIYCARCNTMLCCRDCHKKYFGDKVIVRLNSNRQRRLISQLPAQDLRHLPENAQVYVDAVSKND